MPWLNPFGCRRHLLTLLLLGFPVSIALSQAADNTENFAVTGVNVIPMDEERLLDNQTVIVRNGHIFAVGDAATTSVPAGLTRIDGDGRFLMPGLADLHIHLRYPDELVQYLAWGVTTVMHLGGSGQTGEQQLELRRQISAGELIGPNVYTTGRILDGDPALPNDAYKLTNAADARQAVQETAAGGFDFIKIYNNVSQPVFEAIVDEASRHDLSVIGHIPRSFDPLLALGGGQKAIAHTEELFFTYFGGPRDEKSMSRDYQPDLSRLPRLIDVLRDNDVALMPDLSFTFTNLLMWDGLDMLWADPELPNLHPATASMWQRGNINRRTAIENFMLREQWKYNLLQTLTLEFQKAGLLQVIGTDASLPGLFPGNAVHRELTELVKAGLSNFDALAMGSRNAGEFLRRYIDKSARFGQIKPGYRADLLLLNENPLEDVRNARSISAVAVNGRYIDISVIDAERKTLRERYALLASINDRVDAAMATPNGRAVLDRMLASHGSDNEVLATIESRINSAGYAAVFSDDLDRAKYILQLNTALFPQSPNTWDSLAELALSTGDADRALALYRQALKVDPNFSNAAVNIEKILKDRGNR